MKIIQNITYKEFLALLLTYTANADDDFDLSEKYMITKKIEFEDLKKAETIIKQYDDEQVIDAIKEGYKIFALDEQKKKQIMKDLSDVINCDGFIHESEKRILYAMEELSDQLSHKAENS